MPARVPRWFAYPPMSNHDEHDRGPRRIVAWIIGGLLVAVGLVAFLRSRVPGEAIGSRPIPGSIELDLRAGDVLRFHADTEVLFRNFSRNAKPRGCVLEVTLVRAGQTLAAASCDLYSSGDGFSGHGHKPGQDRHPVASVGSSDRTRRGLGRAGGGSLAHSNSNRSS